MKHTLKAALLLASACVGLAWLSAAPALAAAPRSVTVDNETLGKITVLAPVEQPQRFAVFISDRDGLTAERLTQAEALVTRGAAVALLDLPALRARLAQATDEKCFYTFGDIEDLARNAQRALNMSSWRWPIMFGVGEGGTLAYLLLAQAPDNTAGGAVSIGFEPKFEAIRPMCPGAPMASQTGDVVSYTPMDDVPGPWALILPQEPSAEVATFKNAAEDSKLSIIPGSDAERFDAAANALFEMAPQRPSGLSDLPLVELPGTGKPSSLLILISGDGGWRDIDKQIGEYIANGGVSVIGVDSLRYFWDRKEPKQIAADLGRIADYYLEKWQLQQVAFSGYSFGADVIPLAWPLISRDVQARTRLIAFLGLEPTADLQVSVTGLLGIVDSNDIPIAPYLPALPKDKVVCFYGEYEASVSETACVEKGLDGATRIQRPGGHHFDGNYEPVAQAIIDRLK